MAGKKGKGKNRKKNGSGDKQNAAPAQPPPIPPAVINQNDAGEKDDHRHHVDRRNLPKRNWSIPWRKIWGPAGVIAGCIVAFGTWEMMNSSREQIELVKLEQRPWIGFDGLPEMKPFVEGDDITMRITAHNSGKLPGRVIRFAHHIDFLPKTTFEEISAYTHKTKHEMKFDFARTLAETREKKAVEFDRVVTAGADTKLPIDTEWRMSGDLLRPIEAEVMQPILVLFIKYVDLPGTIEKEAWGCFIYDRQSGYWLRDSKYDYMD
jgi:hypothetical protein